MWSKKFLQENIDCKQYILCVATKITLTRVESQVVSFVKYIYVSIFHSAKVWNRKNRNDKYDER